MSGSGSNPHIHFSSLSTPGPESIAAENFPIYFNNIQAISPGQGNPRRQLDTSLRSNTLITAILPVPAPMPRNAPDGPGAVTETEPNDVLANHQALVLPATVSGVLEMNEVGDLAVRGDGIEDIYRVDFSVPSILQVDLQGYLASENLDVYVINGDQYRVLNPTREGTSLNLSEQVCLTMKAGAYYTLVTNAQTPAGQDTDYVLTMTSDKAPVLNIPGDLDFGDTCVGETSTLMLDICNTGGDTEACHLDVKSIVSSDPQFEVTAPTSGFPVEVSSDFCFPFQVKFSPDGTGPQSATLTIETNDPVNPTIEVQVMGIGTEHEIVITGSGEFGDVCAEELQEKTISVCNVGDCDLEVFEVSTTCADFRVINNPFPATVGMDFCVDVTVQFTPITAGNKSCFLKIVSDDADESQLFVSLTGNTPFGSIDVPPDHAFPPTVIQSVGSCSSAQPFPVSNIGICNLDITAFEISSNADEYSLSGLPSFPIILESGHIAGAGDLRTVFEPDSIDRARTGAVEVTWVHDPITGQTMSQERQMCGEGVYTGARVLVTAGGLPMEEVHKIQLRRLTGNVNGNRLDSIDTAMRVSKSMEDLGAPCGAFFYHREYGTESNPIQLAPGSYQVTVMARVDGRMRKKTVGFDVNTCGFNPTIKVDF